MGAEPPASEKIAIPATSSTSTPTYPPCTLPTGFAHLADGVQRASACPPSMRTTTMSSGWYVYCGSVIIGTLDRSALPRAQMRFEKPASNG